MNVVVLMACSLISTRFMVSTTLFGEKKLIMSGMVEKDVLKGKIYFREFIYSIIWAEKSRERNLLSAQQYLWHLLRKVPHLQNFLPVVFDFLKRTQLYMALVEHIKN